MSGAALTLAAVLAMAARPECNPRAIEPERLAGMVTGESGFDPLAIHVNGPNGGQSIRPRSTAEAAELAARLIASGQSVDLGLFQINSTNLARHGLSIAAAFEPCASMRAGADHIASDFEAAWRAAHCRYNTGRLDCSNGYPERIERARLGIVRARAGSTPPASAPTPAPPAKEGLHDAVRFHVAPPSKEASR
ncbi:MAG: conjugal transfer protein [Spirosoma sp.]|nr:conjugal transfer protein [Spirosoma sp.]